MKTTEKILLLLFMLIVSTLLFVATQEESYRQMVEGNSELDITFSMLGWVFFAVDAWIISKLMNQ